MDAIQSAQTDDTCLPLGSLVMAGLVPAIRRGTNDGTDGQDKPGHDGEGAVITVNGSGGWYATR